MNSTTQSQLIEELEPLIDKFSLSEVILALGLVCHEKAEHHLQVNWQDGAAARHWTRAAKACAKLGGENNAVLNVS